MQNTSKDFHKKLLGRKGEKAVLKRMTSDGFKLIKSNYKTPFGEADILLEKDGITYFVEVKTRSGFLYGEPKDAVDYRKREKYGKIAEYYMLTHPDAEICFTVAEVVNDEINVLYDAF